MNENATTKYKLDLHDWRGEGKHAILTAEGFTIVEWSSNGGASLASEEAAAELVHRANTQPELLEALEAASELLDKYVSSASGSPWEIAQDRAICDNAFAAISNARKGGTA